MQKAVFKQQFEAFKISNSEGLEKRYYRVFEQEIQGAPKTSSSAQNVAFVSQSKSSTNKVKSGFSGAYSSCTPSTSSTNIPEKEVLAGFADEVIYSLFAKQTEDLDLLHEDLEQIDDVDIEEMDINWQIAMIAIRMKMFYKKTRMVIRVEWKKPVGFDKKESLSVSMKQEKNQMGLLTIDDGIVNWGEHTEAEETNQALMAIRLNNESIFVSKTCNDSYYKLKTHGDEPDDQLGTKDQLEEFEDFKGGSVTFGGSKGYITGKGRIKVGNLEFDNVSFVEELGQFNLFSISQICDKQHKAASDESKCGIEISILENQANKQTVRFLRKDRIKDILSINSKTEETLTEPQQEMKDSSIDSLEDKLNSSFLEEINTGSQTVNTGRLDHDDSIMPELEIFHKPETGIFDEASYDEEGVITDFNSLPTEIEVSPTPTLRIHSIHPKSQILGDPKSAVQTRSKVQNKSGAHALLSHIQKQQRNNHKDQQHCFKAMQEELFTVPSYNKYWVLVDLPHGKKVTPKIFSSQFCQENFKYLKETKLGLWYPGNPPFDVEKHISDSDYGWVQPEMKSPQAAAANCCGQVLWVQNQLLDYGFNFMNTKIHIDNESTICIVKNPVYHSKTKHIEIRHHFIRDCYEKKLISVEKIHTDLNVADLLTKPFDGPRFNYLVVSIVGFLRKPDESVGFAEIVDFLRGSNLRYALTSNPTIYDSLVKQFWQTATTNTKVDGTPEIKATIDTIGYTITEASIIDTLQLEDATGITMLPNDELFEGMGQMGYPTDGTFTFWKSFFTPQWRYLVHHLLHCISSKSGGWDQFGSNIATALICLSTDRVYNFSKLIFDVPSPQPIPTPTPPPISTPTPPPIPTPTPPPIPTPTPPPIPTPTPTPIPDTEPTPLEHIYEEQSPVHHHFSPPQEQAPSQMPMDDLLHEVPKLISRIDSLETDLKQTKLTMGNAIVKLVKKVKKLEGFLKRRNLVLSDSEEEEPEVQGRKSSREEQVEDISPNTLEAAKTLSKVASLKPRSIDKGRRYKRRKEAKGKLVSQLDFQEEVDTGAEQVNTAEGVNTGSIKLSTVSEQLSTGNEQVSTVGAKKSTSSQDKGQREGKAPMLSEETPKKLDSLQKEEEAKQIHLDSLLAQRIAEEEELNEQQKKRKAQVQFEAQHYTNEDWDLIRAKIEANAEKKYFAEERARAKRNKPMTQSQLKTYMMNYLKNQGTWKLSQLKKLSFEEVKEEFDKLVKQVESFAPINFEATKAKVWKKKKTDGKERIAYKCDKNDSEDSDEVGEQEESVTGTKTPINPVPVAMKTPSIATYKIIKQGEKGVYQIVREDGTDIVYINFGAMLKSISRDDLTELYRIVMNRYGMDGPEDELEKGFWKCLRTMFEEPLSTDPIWSELGQQKIISMSNYAENEILDGKDECGWI
ncbi:hypothetical protein Tco_0096779 [Tanacetum coccineum]